MGQGCCSWDCFCIWGNLSQVVKQEAFVSMSNEFQEDKHFS